MNNPQRTFAVLMDARSFEILDPQRFAQLLSAGSELRKLAGGMKFVEGPAWFPDNAGGHLIFSDINGDELKRWSDDDGLQTFRKPANHPNGNTRDHDGRLLTCEHSSRRITRTDGGGNISVLIDRYKGKRFNSPNDLVVKSDGSIWFTDPPYGLASGEQSELDGHFVFRFEPHSGAIKIVADDFDMPNGLCFAPDENHLYIADSGKPHHIRVFDVKADSSLAGGEVFCTIDTGVPDGIRCDEHGNLWSSAGDGIHIFAPAGKLLARIFVAETPANLCFGGADHRTLFITARTSLYSIPTRVCGAV